MTDVEELDAQAQAELFCLACRQPVPEWGPGGPRGRPRARCPRCGALERHRFLAFVLEQLALFVSSARAVLDVAPQRQVQHVLTRLAPDAYVATDLYDHLGVHLRSDVTRLPFPDGAFDLIVCYHVLEHVPDDRAAMRELARVLGPGGRMLVQVPWRRGRPTDEDPSAPREERVRRFGQDDHVRYYGADFEERLAACGLRPYRFEPRDLIAPAELDRLALVPNEAVWLCRRARPGDDGSVLPALHGLRRTALASTGAGEECLEARRDADEARARYERLRARRSVRVALALAGLSAPAFRLARRLRRSDGVSH